MLREAWPQGLPNLRFGGQAESEHPSGRREIRNSFEVPGNDGLFGHEYNPGCVKQWQPTSGDPTIAVAVPKAVVDSRAKCNRALREPDLHVFAKLFEDCLKRSLEAQAFSGREIGGDDDVLDFLVGHFVDVDLTRQPAS